MIAVRFLRPAEAEAEEAVAYFDEQRDGLGDRFENVLQETLDFIVRHPLAGKTLSARIRSFGLRPFPYSVIYAADDHEIVIVAVAHHRRRPGYWRNRLTNLP